MVEARSDWAKLLLTRPAVPVSEETLSAARIGIPPRVRAHGLSLCGQKAEGRMDKASRYQTHRLCLAASCSQPNLPVM